MKLTNTLSKVIASGVIIFTFFSCDDDFNTVGSEIIGDVNFIDSKYISTPIAYSKKFERVQTSALPVNMLGVYNDPTYNAQSTYGILSQVLPNRFNPDFGDNAVLDSLVLNMPYFSTVTDQQQVDIVIGEETITETATTYELDSIYGNSPIRLSIYKSNYFLRDFDPETSERQLYFSNDIEDNFAAEAEEILLYTDESFIPSASELILVQADGSDNDTLPDRSRVTPRLRISFSDEVKDLFTAQFLDKEDSPELSNPNNFRNYFRGIYFKAEQTDVDGNLVYFDMSEAQLTLHYSFDKTDVSDEDGDCSTDDIVRDEGTFELSFSNNIVNSISTTLDATIAEELRAENQDTIAGESNLYLKGGDGSYAVLDFFGTNILNENGEEENEYEFLKRQNWLINEANIKFYIDQDKVTSGDAEPERIFIFDIETGQVLADYRLDIEFGLANDTDPVNSILNHLGRISRDSDGRGEFYQLGVTQHIINVLNEDAENTKLGLSVSQNVNLTNVGSAFTPTDAEDENIPLSSIISNEGTILFGNGSTVPESKGLQLEIFYTESKDN